MRLFFLFLLCLTNACVCCAQAEVYDVVITEVQSNNTAGWEFDFSDYIEICNNSDQAISLSDYAVSRKADRPFDYPLPDQMLLPGEYTVLLCDTDLNGMSLSKNGFTLYLYHKNGMLCDLANIPPMADAVWQRDAGLTSTPSPGYENSPEGARKYLHEKAAQQKLIISEVMSSNSSQMPVDKAYYDLIELMNVGSEPLNLCGYYLSDSKDNLKQWQLPSVTLNPGKCFTVYASGIDNKNRHAPFKISSDGETLYLSTSDGRCADVMVVPVLPHNASYGRYDNSLYYYDTPTIGAKNNTGAAYITAIPTASTGSSLLTESILVTLQGEGDVYYTLDGRTPSETTGMLYTGSPLTIDNNTVLRVRAKKENALWSPVRTYTYLFDAEKYELPLLCISSEPGKVLGSYGIYARYTSKSVEAAVNLTFIVDGHEEFSVDCGLKIHGQSSRKLDKKSFQVRFRGKYGCNELEYKMFDNSPRTTFNSLVLRSGSTDSYNSFFRDEFFTSLTAETMPEVLYQRHRPVNLFINGEYFGLYYIRERAADDYAAAYLGGDDEDIDMIKGWTSAEHGTAKAFDALLRYCRINDLSNQEKFDYVASQICLESFMDYYIARAYSADLDYDNIRHVRSTGGDGKWRLLNFDLDFGYRSKSTAFSTMIGTVTSTSYLNTVIINALLENDGFRDQMLTRLAWHLRNTYNPERVLAHIDQMVSAIDHDIVYNFEVWPRTYAHWQKSVQGLRDKVQSGDYSRIDAMIADAKRAFRMTEEEVVHYFGDLYTK